MRKKSQLLKLFSIKFYGKNDLESDDLIQNLFLEAKKLEIGKTKGKKL